MTTAPTINAAMKRISNYCAHDYCDSEMEAEFKVTARELEICRDLLHHNGQPLLTKAGRDFLSRQAKDLIASCDTFARDLNLTKRRKS